MTHRGIICERSQRLTGLLCLRPDASQCPGRADAHIEEFIVQCSDQLRHSGVRGRANASEGLGRRPSDTGNRIAQGCGEVPGRQGLRRVNADVGFSCESVLTSEHTEGLALWRKAPRARAASLATIESSSINASAAKRRNETCSCRSSSTSSGMGRRADLPDNFKSLLMQVFIVTFEESSQQR